MTDQSSRIAMRQGGQFLRVNGLILDLFERTVLVPAHEDGDLWREQEVIELTNIEFKLLYCLMASPDVAHSRSYLLQVVWRLEQPIASNRVEVAVKQLRRKIGTSFVLSVRGRGYKLANDVWGCSPERISRSTVEVARD